MKICTGFTLIELILIMGVIAVLFAVSSINLTGSQQKASVNSTIASLVADIKSQQFKAMTGDGGTDHGIRFDTTSYILLPENFVVDLGNNLQLSTTFPANTITFSQGSGEITGFTTGSDTVTLGDQTLRLNLYGVITSQN